MKIRDHEAQIPEVPPEMEKSSPKPSEHLRKIIPTGVQELNPVLNPRPLSTLAVLQYEETSNPALFQNYNLLDTPFEASDPDTTQGEGAKRGELEQPEEFPAGNS